MATSDNAQHPLGPFKLVTVNTAPERAKKIVGRLCEEVKDRYRIDYLANSTSKWSLVCVCIVFLRLMCDLSAIDGVRAMVEEHKPDVLVSTHK